MPLVIAPLDIELKIIKLLMNDADKKHFESLGIGVNQIISIISRSSGNIIIRVKNGRIAIDKNIATKIIVCEA